MSLKTSFSILFILVLTTSLFATRGPVHKSFRAMTMGNAFVAVSDDKEAVYYNPAGLNLMGKLGNYKTDPELGYYPNDWLDMQFNIGGGVPYGEARTAYSLLTDLNDIYNDSKEAGNYAENLSENGQLMDDLIAYDRKPVLIAPKVDFEMAFHNFGGSIWIDGEAQPYLDGGIIAPSAGFKDFYVDVVMQAAGAYGFTKTISGGAGYKIVKRERIKSLELNILEADESQDKIEDEVEDAQSNLTSISSIGHALEFGGMYQWKRETRLGASVRNLFLTTLDGEAITPDVTFGIAHSPRKFQRNTAYARKVNFAADYADLFNNDRNYKFFSHLNFGMEYEQVLLAIPSLTLGSNARALAGRLALGLQGGYWTAGGTLEVLRVLSFSAGSWAEEAGYFTGQEEKRYWVVEFGMGF
jgi:hypothetical protein